MRTLFVTGSDTGVGKTHATAALAQLLAGTGARVQIVKAVETGRAAGRTGDAARAGELAGGVAAFTLKTFAAPLAPLAAAEAEGAHLSLEELTAALDALPPCDWRVVEGAGGIAVPVDSDGRDWADFATAIAAERVVLVVADRLGAINQARLAQAYAESRDLRAGVWLNATAPADPQVAAANRVGLLATQVPLWATQAHDAGLPENPEVITRFFTENPETDGDSESAGVVARCREALAVRTQRGLRRGLRVQTASVNVLNLADNDYLALARDPAVAEAVGRAARDEGSSAAASPLVTGWRPAHERLMNELCAWHGLPFGLLWTSGYAANAGVLGVLPARGDLVLADRLIHHSMIAGLLRSGARLQRYRHLDLDQLEKALTDVAGRTVFVVTESVFSMDGDYPDLARLAELKNRYGFFWILDEAHGLGWYGAEGAGLAREAGVAGAVDVLVGTFGKTLASGGAYTLFRDETVRDHVMNTAGEFIYSTAMPPPAAAGALAALERVRTLAVDQPVWRAMSRRFRGRLRAAGWDAMDGDSPVVPVRIGEAARVVALAAALREAGILAAAVRPPTVPEGTSRLRFSLKRTFDDHQAGRVLAAMEAWRRGA
ncbi:MAG: dethiobiotin synthase [Verrucomicrobia bacterium]|nr:dethiobiotin synthase [Verrucomicrobiota bacterium]